LCGGNAACHTAGAPRDQRGKGGEEMRPRFIYVGLMLAAGLAAAIAAEAPQFTLRGDRFKPLAWEAMTPEQRMMAEHVLAGKRGSLDGPYNVLLRSPVMGDLAQKFGEYTRYDTSIPHKLNELAILVTARFWGSQYEWYSHHKYGLEAGLSPTLIDELAAGRRPSRMSDDESVIYDFCHELLYTKAVSDDTFAATKEKFGERGIVDLIGVMGYYHVVAMALNVDRYPLPDNAKPELSALGP
jgi:4-carboxymuconolactone decarboxylase